MPQLDIITFSSSYVWFLFIIPFLVVKFIGVIVISLRFISMLISVHDILSSALNSFYNRNIGFFVPLECFLVRNGSYIVMTVTVLYFYTSSFPAIIASIWLPIFIVMRVNAVVRRSKQFLNYLENRRLAKLEEEIRQLYERKQLEAALLAAGWGVVPSSVLDKLAASRKAYKFQSFVQFPPFKGYDYDLYERNNRLAIEESEKLGRYVSGRTGLPMKSQEVRDIIRSSFARRTHARPGIRLQDSDLAITLGLSTKNSFNPKVFVFNGHEGSVTAADVTTEELGSCFIKGKAESQYLVTNPVQIHSSSGGISINDFIEQFPHINDEFFYDPILRDSLLKLLDQCGDFLLDLGRLPLEERCRLISNAKAQGLPRDVNDYSMSGNSGYDGVVTVVMDLFS